MSTLFIAVQCFQCSTMQVKQHKKSSNKWVCAVCNQRQSVRQIHARSYRARDLRQFVQAFNMSRGTASASDGRDPVPPQSDGSRAAAGTEEIDCSGGGGFQPKKRMDWSEYMDPQEEKGEGDREPDAVSELPREKLPRSFQNRPPRVQRTQTTEENELSSVPVISKRKLKTMPTESRKSQRAATESGRSRWNEYLDDGDLDGEGSQGEGSARSDGFEARGGGASHLGDTRMEDEVHPDFK